MWPKSPRIRRNENEFKKNSPSTPYNKSSLGIQLRNRRLVQNQRMQKKSKSVEKQKNMSPGKELKALPLAQSLSNISLGGGVPKVVDQKKPDQEPNSDAKSKLLSARTIAFPPYMALKRQQTAAMISFRARKSVSQIDFKEARRTGNYQVVLSGSQALVPGANHATQLTKNNNNISEFLLRDVAAQICCKGQGDLRCVISGDQDVRMASLRIVNVIMLRTWRRRRAEVSQLNEQLKITQRNVANSRSQLYVYNMLFGVEKRRNEALNDRLKLSYVDCAKTQMTCDELSLMLKQANEEKEQLAKDNASKSVEIENLQGLLQETKRELFATNAQQREQLEHLSRLQLECKDAKFDILDLTNQLHSLKQELTQKQEYVEKMRDNITIIADELKLSSGSLQEYKKETDAHIGKLMKHAAELEKQLKEKEEKVVMLENCLAATVGQRLRHCIERSQPYQQATCRLVHIAAYCMFPATPPPSLPMSTIPGIIRKLGGLFQRRSAGGSSDEKLEDKNKE